MLTYTFLGVTGFMRHNGIFLSPYDTGSKEFNRIAIVKSILRIPWEDAVHKSTKDVASIVTLCKDKLNNEVKTATKLLGVNHSHPVLQRRKWTRVSRSCY